MSEYIQTINNIINNTLINSVDITPQVTRLIDTIDPNS